MSFSYEIKREIMTSQYKNFCCRRNIINGILSAKANVISDHDNSVGFNIENDEIALFAKGLIKEAFAKDATVSSGARGGRCKFVTFESKAAKNYVEASLQGGLLNEKCPLCKMAFLRGLFLACGRLTDPTKRFCLEFSLGNKIDAYYDMLNDLGLEFKISNRRSEVLLYTKNSAVIEDFFSFAELHNATFTIINTKIANDLKNNANRLRNFDTVNISKAVDAANAQITLIKELEERNLLTSLPEELEQTARMRLQNPDMSLSRLAQASVPPITKSGITHRMAKIMKLGEEILRKYK